MAGRNTSPISIFVPGRLCLVGEHSDTAGGFRTLNPSLTPGHAIVAATVEGIHADVTLRNEQDHILHLSSVLAGTASITPDNLLPTARDKRHPWRYAAAVAYLIHDRFDIAGANILLSGVSLPAAKGLSSSAALCVLVARAFNLLYNLRLTTSAEMELAYTGERLTGSLCGRMDQCVASFGHGTVALMTFDGDVFTHKLLQPTTNNTSRDHQYPSTPIYIVFADLAAAKDTAVILRDLQAAYPFATTPQHHKLHQALGHQNEHIVRRVAQAILDSDAAALGALFDEAQALFDECASPLCPAQLTAPRLHEALHNPLIRALVYGGKGVGSQGDGAVQFVARGHAEAEQLIPILHSLGMRDARILPIDPNSNQPSYAGAAGHTSTNVSLKSGQGPAHHTNGRVEHDLQPDVMRRSSFPKSPAVRSVRTAVIPAAGFGTRLFPASRSIRPKALMPIIDRDGFVKPLLLHLVEQCVSVGLTKVLIVSGPGDQVVRIQEVFSKVEGPLASKLKPHMRDYASKIAQLEDIVEIVVQETPEGFGHAVAQAHEKLDPEEPFVLLLGDVVFTAPEKSPSCLEQVLDIFNRDPEGRGVIGVSEVPLSEAGAYGVVHTEHDHKTDALNVLKFVEKPDQKTATSLAENGRCKIVLGPYVFSRVVMDALLKDVQDDARVGGEIQLTPAVSRVKDSHGLLAVVLKGEALDTGNPAEYAETMTRLAQHVFPRSVGV